MNLENDPRNNDTDIKIPHSGENVVREFDKTPLAEAVDGNMLSTPQSPEDLPLDQAITHYETKKTTDKKIGRKVIATISGLLLAGGLGFGAKSMTSSDERVAPTGQVATAPATTPTEQVSPTAQATKTPEVIAQTDKFSPEKLEKLTPAQLTELFHIKGDEGKTPEKYVAALASRLTGIFNAGHTPGEWEQYANAGVDVYAAAMVDKYAAPISYGVFNFNGGTKDDTTFGARYNEMSLAGREAEYKVTVAVVEGSLHATVRPDGFDVEVTMHTTDTLRIADIVGDVDGTKKADSLAVFTMKNVKADSEGNYFATSVSEK